MVNKRLVQNQEYHTAELLAVACPRCGGGLGADCIGFRGNVTLPHIARNDAEEESQAV
jgi:hypothetical protein